ncbi:MAG: hypothetical protein ACLT76_04365 [Clostridium fessum]
MSVIFVIPICFTTRLSRPDHHGRRCVLAGDESAVLYSNAAYTGANAICILTRIGFGSDRRCDDGRRTRENVYQYDGSGAGSGVR